VGAKHAPLLTSFLVEHFHPSQPAKEEKSHGTQHSHAHRGTEAVRLLLLARRRAGNDHHTPPTVPKGTVDH
jgi:hypothetical protein